MVSRRCQVKPAAEAVCAEGEAGAKAHGGHKLGCLEGGLERAGGSRRGEEAAAGAGRACGTPVVWAKASLLKASEQSSDVMTRAEGLLRFSES